MKLFYFVLTIIIFSMIFSIFLKPYRLIEKDIKKVAEVEFVNFILYNIDKNGTKNSLSGEKGEKFSDRFEIENLKAFWFDKDEKLTAKRGIYKKDKIYLYKNIKYIAKGFSFFTDKAEYDLKRDILKTKGEFRLILSSANIKGKDLIYYKNKGKILAKSIYANIKEK